MSPGFISYYNLNFAKYHLVISIFATFAGGHKCIKERQACPNKNGKSTALSKSSNSEFHLCPRSKPHLQNSLIDLRAIFFIKNHPSHGDQGWTNLSKLGPYTSIDEPLFMAMKFQPHLLQCF